MEERINRKGKTYAKIHPHSGGSATRVRSLDGLGGRTGATAREDEASQRDQQRKDYGGRVCWNKRPHPGGVKRRGSAGGVTRDSSLIRKEVLHLKGGAPVWATFRRVTYSQKKSLG